MFATVQRPFRWNGTNSGVKLRCSKPRDLSNHVLAWDDEDEEEEHVGNSSEE